MLQAWYMDKADGNVIRIQSVWVFFDTWGSIGAQSLSPSIIPHNSSCETQTTVVYGSDPQPPGPGTCTGPWIIWYRAAQK